MTRMAFEFYVTTIHMCRTKPLSDSARGTIIRVNKAHERTETLFHICPATSLNRCFRRKAFAFVTWKERPAKFRLVKIIGEPKAGKADSFVCRSIGDEKNTNATNHPLPGYRAKIFPGANLIQCPTDKGLQFGIGLQGSKSGEVLHPPSAQAKSIGCERRDH